MTYFKDVHICTSFFIDLHAAAWTKVKAINRKE